MYEVWVALIIFFAAFTQSLSGFGLGLVAMPLLSSIINLHLAAPLVSTISIIINISLTLYYQSAFQLNSIKRLACASVLAIPLGIFESKIFPESLMLKGLGMLILGYSLLSLSSFNFPEIRDPRWAYGFGFVSGIFSGAYNIGGPPVVIYGNCRRWPPEIFKSNLNSFFLLNNLAVLINHFLHHNFTNEVIHLLFYGVPAAELGFFLGLFCSKKISELIFNKLILLLLSGVGIKLLFG